MMTYEQEQRIKKHIQQFVMTLGTRYREHCSDAFLAEVLFHHMRWWTVHSRDRVSTAPGEWQLQIAYDASVPVFEAMLEHGCRAGGNGHHVAQRFARFMQDKLP